MKNKVEVKTLELTQEKLDLQHSSVMINRSNTFYGDWGISSLTGSRRVCSKMTARKGVKTENSPQRIHMQP